MKFVSWNPALAVVAAGVIVFLVYRLGFGLYVENERLQEACRRGRPPGGSFRGILTYLLCAGALSAALSGVFVAALHTAAGRPSPPGGTPTREVVLMVDPPPSPPPGPQSPEPAGCRPLPFGAARDLAESIAREEGVAPELVLAVIYRESRFLPCAVSPSGALGLMQLKPATARLMGVHDLFDPEQNIRAGARYLRFLLDRFGGNVTLALGAYHAGPGRVSRYAHIEKLPATRRYVGDVLSLAGALAGD